MVGKIVESRKPLNVNRSRAFFGSRAFFHAVPTVWNCPPADLNNNLSSIASFKRCLETYLLVPSIIRSPIPAGPPRLQFIITLIDLRCVTNCVLSLLLLLLKYLISV